MFTGKDHLKVLPTVEKRTMLLEQSGTDYSITVFLHLVTLFHWSIAGSLMKKYINVAIWIKCDFPKIAKISTQQDTPIFDNRKN